MTQLPTEILHVLNYTKGWLELGCIGEAIDESNKIPVQYRQHPEFLITRWEIFVQGKQWGPAWVVSRVLCEVVPNNVNAWICHGNSTNRHKGPKEAFDLLFSIQSKFSTNAVIAYNMACYASLFNDLIAAHNWLMESFRLQEKYGVQTRECEKNLKNLAKTDPDLQNYRDAVEYEKT